MSIKFHFRYLPAKSYNQEVLFLNFKNKPDPIVRQTFFLSPMPWSISIPNLREVYKTKVNWVNRQLRRPKKIVRKIKGGGEELIFFTLLYVVYTCIYTVRDILQRFANDKDKWKMIEFHR